MSEYVLLSILFLEKFNLNTPMEVSINDSSCYAVFFQIRGAFVLKSNLVARPKFSKLADKVRSFLE